MNEMDKLRVLIPHWVEHNQEHANEFLDWVKQIEHVTAEVAIADMQAAVEAMKTVNAHLGTALEKLGGPLEYAPDHSHTHPHDHDHDHAHHHSHDHDHGHARHHHEHDHDHDHGHAHHEHD